MKYLFIDTQKALFPLYLLLRILDVNSSSYHYWNTAGRTNYQARQAAELVLVDEILDVAVMSNGTYGSPRMTVELNAKGTTVSERRVAETMARHRITGTCGVEPSTRTTIPSKKRKPFPDLVERRFLADIPDTVWYGDITYIWVKDRFYYLATVIDAATKEVVGWGLEDNMETPLITSALASALKRRGIDGRGLIFHSDRGSQYTSDDFTGFCKARKIRQSMGRKATCYDNAAAESFFATIKRELVDRWLWDDPMILRFEVFEWIEGWYNTRRRHTTIGSIAPAQCYADFNARKAS